MYIHQQLLETNRLFMVLHDNLTEDIKQSALMKEVGAYLDKYANFNHITVDVVIEMYTDFISTYNRHCKIFIKTGKYPTENGLDNFFISREAYDITLLLSVLFTKHRFRIMQLLSQQPAADKALFIGLGSGLEMSLNRKKYKEIHAYDLSINEFVYSEFASQQIHTELYKGQRQDYFDAIYLIELLEHLEDPFQLLEICHGSLKKGGRISLTTATDIPQFDHLYNFPKDHRNFEERLNQLGYTIIIKEIIEHNYITTNIKPSNHFYSIAKS